MSTIIDATYHFEQLKKFVAGEWFLPTNKDGNDFSICADLFEWGLIERKIEQIVIDGRFKGTRIYFKY